jgi:16S rRNA (guanine527-N7)-methyltransferase
VEDISGGPEDLNVSRETMAALDRYAALLKRWTARINLIGKSTLPDIWMRHIVDSAQLAELAGSEFRRWVDMGSGGGLPGLVIAILARERWPQAEVVLVEADARKAAFLRTAVRELGLRTRVEARRIEALPALEADRISARALAPLSMLLTYVQRHGTADCVSLFPKGAQVDDEIAVALEHWRFDCEKIPSVTAPESFILKIGDLRRA